METANRLRLLQLPEEVILSIGDALVASPSGRIADLVAAARTCKALHRILAGLAYLTAIQRDAAQLLERPLPELSLASVAPALPVALWAAERDRTDTLALLWEAQRKAQAQAQAQAHPGSRDRRRRRQTTALLSSAFWYPLPHACQHNLAHTRWRRQTWYDENPAADALLMAGWCTPLHLAASRGNDAAVRALVCHYGAPVDATARHVCICGSRHLRLIIHDEEIRHPDDGPITTPLHVALARRHDSTARLLVELGANWSQDVRFRTSVNAERCAEALFWDDPRIHSHIQSHHVRSDSRHSPRWTSSSSSSSSSSSAYPAPPSYNRPRPQGVLGSSMGSSHGASGLRIAAANAMMPFLHWLLVDRGDKMQRDAAPTPGLELGTLHFAAHSSAFVTRAGSGAQVGRAAHGSLVFAEGEDQDRDRDRDRDREGDGVGVGVGVDYSRCDGEEGGEEEEEGEAGSAGSAIRKTARATMGDLVASLLALGVQWTGETEQTREDIVEYARVWGNYALVSVLEGLGPAGGQGAI